MQPIVRFATLGRALVAEIDHGTHLGSDETQARIRDGSLFEWLRLQLEWSDVARLDDADRREVLEVFVRLSNAQARDSGGEDNGLALLAMLCFDALQLQG